MTKVTKFLPFFVVGSESAFFKHEDSKSKCLPNKLWIRIPQALNGLDVDRFVSGSTDNPVFDYTNLLYCHLSLFSLQNSPRFEQQHPRSTRRSPPVEESFNSTKSSLGTHFILRKKPNSSFFRFDLCPSTVQCLTLYRILYTTLKWFC